MRLERFSFPAPVMTIVPASRITPSDHDLLRRASQGDEAALGTLYDRYGSVMYGLAYRIAGERSDAEEIVLDTFAQVWRDAGRFQESRGSVIAWLTMICRSRALDLVRARARRSRLVTAAHVEEPGRSPAMGIAHDPRAGDPVRLEQAARVREAVGELSQPQRQAVELAFYEGLTHSEIAERLGEPLGTVKTRVRLAMQKLRDALGPYYSEQGL